MQGFELEFCWHSLQPLLCLIGSNPSIGECIQAHIIRSFVFNGLVFPIMGNLRHWK